MRRTVILATLVLLLLAVAGVTAATENTFTTPQNEDQLESSSLESTASQEMDEETVETTVETTVEKTVAVPDQPEEPVTEDTDTAENGETTAPEQNTPEADDRDEVQPDDGDDAGKPVGKPNKPDKPRVAGNAMKHGKPQNAGRPDVTGKPEGNGKPGAAGEPEQVGRSGEAGEGREESGGNPGKVTLCHKDRVTISVGAPAEPAHLRHGDILGACAGTDEPAASVRGNSSKP